MKLGLVRFTQRLPPYDGVTIPQCMFREWFEVRAILINIPSPGRNDVHVRDFPLSMNVPTISQFIEATFDGSPIRRYEQARKFSDLSICGDVNRSIGGVVTEAPIVEATVMTSDIAPSVQLNSSTSSWRFALGHEACIFGEEVNDLVNEATVHEVGILSERASYSLRRF